jgi:hypothetical protein
MISIGQLNCEERTINQISAMSTSTACMRARERLSLRALGDDLNMNSLLLMRQSQVAALERAQQSPERRRAAEELAARRDALKAERLALEAEEEGLRAAVAAAAGGRSEAEARKSAAAEELARARSEVEAAREKDTQVPDHLTAV